MTKQSIKFTVDEEENLKVGIGETLDAKLYMDTMTFINLKLRVAHKSDNDIGCEFVKTESATQMAIEYYLEYVKIASTFFNAEKYTP